MNEKVTRVHLTTLDEAPDTVVTDYFRECCAAPTYVAAMAGRRPYHSVAAVLAASDEVIGAMSDEDVDAAIAGHPRIGEKPRGSAVSDDHSRREQASMDEAGSDVHEEIREANAAYEQRFDRVFLIRAAGRAPQEMLAEARRRLQNTPEAEIAEVREQLRQITRLRLESTLDARTDTEVRA